MASLADACSALKRFKKEGHPLDPNNEAHIAAYQFILAVSGRPDPKKVVAHLNLTVNKLEHSSETTLKYWGVPKENFTEGLPEDIKPAEKTKEELEDLYLDKNVQTSLLTK